MKTMLDEAEHNKISEKERKSLSKIFAKHKNVFRTSLSVAPLAKVNPLEIILVAEATAVRVRLGNYS